MYGEHSRDKKQGRPRRRPRLKVRNTPACEARNLLTCSPRLRNVLKSEEIKFFLSNAARRRWSRKRTPRE
jgi:hypothetical protein